MGEGRGIYSVAMFQNKNTCKSRCFCFGSHRLISLLGGNEFRLRRSTLRGPSFSWHLCCLDDTYERSPFFEHFDRKTDFSYLESLVGSRLSLFIFPFSKLPKIRTPGFHPVCIILPLNGPGPGGSESGAGKPHDRGISCSALSTPGIRRSRLRLIEISAATASLWHSSSAPDPRGADAPRDRRACHKQRRGGIQGGLSSKFLLRSRDQGRFLRPVFSEPRISSW